MKTRDVVEDMSPNKMERSMEGLSTKDFPRFSATKSTTAKTTFEERERECVCVYVERERKSEGGRERERGERKRKSERGREGKNGFGNIFFLLFLL